MAGPRQSERSTGPSRRAVDAHVGHRVRQRRRELAVSRRQLADALGVSQEQVRRYEAGLATIVASRLYAIGQLLDVPAGHFFEGLAAKPAAPGAAREARGAPNDPELRRFVAAFWSIGDGGARRALLGLIEAIAETS
jgi:transcriptional regulator with XRE-family HTH domain